MKKAIVVIPIYKEELNQFEIISVNQVFSVLKAYDICFVCPEGLSLDYYHSFGDFFVEAFPRRFFESTKAYSRLCLTEDFYKRFIDYYYILIYQTDSFVFSDKLEEYLDLNFDYIGAPLSNETYWDKYHVGNGGLSLRKVYKCLEMLKNKDSIIDDYGDREIIEDYEDHFWSYCGYRKDIDFSVPDVTTAASFSLQDDSCNVYWYMNAHGLPFGVHMWWNGCDSVYWKSCIKRFGYTMSVDDGVYDNWYYLHRQRLFEYAEIWLENSNRKEKQKLLEMLDLYGVENCFIWGIGKYGKYACHVMRKLGIEVNGIIDNFASESIYDGIPIIKPNFYKLNNSLVVVAVRDNKKILEQIENMVLENSTTIVSYEVLNRKAEDYFCSVNMELCGPPL